MLTREQIRRKVRERMAACLSEVAYLRARRETSFPVYQAIREEVEWLQALLVEMDGD